MLRSSLIAAGSVILCTAASAQIGVVDAKPIQSAAKFGGTFHVATGTWTRNVPNSAALGVGDVIYNNTANTGYYSSQTDDVASYGILDAGRIPSTGTAGSADRDNYNITDVTVGYCITNNTANSADVLVSIYGSYTPCEDPVAYSLSGEFLGTGLPGATAADISAGYASCWIVTFDLSGGGEICILGDADGNLDSDLDFDSFGIGLEYDPGGLGGYVNSGIDFGSIMAGDRLWTVQATGEITASGGAGVAGCGVAATGGGGDTYYGPAECCIPALGGDNSSGLDNQDFAWISFDATSIWGAPGCYWLGGYDNAVGCSADAAQTNPNLAHYVTITADASNDCTPSTVGGGLTITTFCDPALNNSTGAPAVMTGTDGSGFESDLHLDVSGGPLPIGTTRLLGYFLCGNEATSGQAISDGLFCLVGTSTASFGRYNIGGTTQYSLGLFDANGDLQNMVGTGGTSGYGFDVPSTINIAGFPTATIMTGDTYHFQCWYRDSAAGAGHSNFSNGITVTW